MQLTDQSINSFTMIIRLKCTELHENKYGNVVLFCFSLVFELLQFCREINILVSNKLVELIKIDMVQLLVIGTCAFHTE